MSGDAQPKKRKDKRRRKEDEELYGHLKNPTDEVIHVQKEAGLGGNICTKVIFFILLGAIGVTVGLILFEYHGSTDEDVAFGDETPWNLAFKEWVEYLPVLPDIIRGDTDEHHHSEDVGHSEEEHEDDLGVEGGETESWLSVGTKWLSEFEFDFSFSGSSVSQDVEEAAEEEGDTSQGDGEIEGISQEDVEDREDEEEKSEELTEEEPDEEEQTVEEEDEEQSVEEEDEEQSVEEEVKDAENSEEVTTEEGDEEESNDQEEEEEQEGEEVDDKEEEDEEEDLSLEDLGRELENEDEVEEENISLEDLGRELEDNVDSEKEEEEEEEEQEYTQKEDDEQSDEDAFNRSNNEPESNNVSDETETEQLEENEQEQGSDDGTESVEDLKLRKHDTSEEELFPEAIEALKREASELLRAQAEVKAAETTEQEGETLTYDDSETEGIETNQPITTELKSKEEIKEKEATSTEVPTFEAVRVPAYTTAPPTLAPPSVKEEMLQKVVNAPVDDSDLPPSLQPMSAEPEEVSEEEEEEEEEEVEETGAADEEIDEDVGLSPKRYQELLAKYGQPTPESSDIEQSDDEPPGVREYSDGGEAESVGEEESANEVEESDPEEVEEEEETYIKVEKPVKTPAPVELESEDEEEEEEEEEEESEDEPPPPPPPKKPASSTPTTGRGGPKDIEEDYPNAEITNTQDWEIKEELDLADEEFNFDRLQSALDKFTLILSKRPKSARALYGIARVLDLQAEAASSNIILDKAIQAYTSMMDVPEIPDELFKRVADRLINRLRFRGQHMKAVPVHRELIKRFNETARYRNDLAINYLMVNRLEEAGAAFKEVLNKWPKDPMARSHYGLVLKLQGKMKECIPHLLAGLSTDDFSTRDARLYFHLGDALTRTGASAEAMKIYENGVEKGLFRCKYQRSLYNVDRLAARPWWTIEQTQYQDFFKKLEDNWKVIKQEALSALKFKGLFQEESENLRDFGDWKQFELFARGAKYESNCRKTPVTCSLIEEFPPARNCKRGQTKFSIMTGGTHVWPHCGPTNCRLRAHLGLIVPNENIAIRVGDEIRKWKAGKVIVFDDSFEHEVWHNGTLPRLVLIVDVWHPELTLQEMRRLSPI